MGRRVQRSLLVLLMLAWPWLQGMGGYFGMQAIPKFDERAGRGAWTGSRDRGLAMHRDLGVQFSREGYPWPLEEPESGQHPNQADLDDAIQRCQSAGIQVELMITGTPFWASTSLSRDPGQPDTYQHGVPRDLYAPIYEDGTDVPAPGKRVNPHHPFARMLARVAERYRGRVALYQIVNEPDYPTGELGAAPRDPARSFQGSVQDYVRMLQVAHTVIGQLDPAARVATGGLGHAAYLAAMLELGAGSCFDVLDFHAYGGRSSDEALGSFLRTHQVMKQVLRHFGQEKPMLCSETGYPAADGTGQAAYISKLYATGLALGLLGIAYYAPTNPSWQQMGLVDWRTMEFRSPGYWAYKNIAQALGSARFLSKLPLPPQIVGYRFQAPGGEVRVLWAPYRDRANAVAWWSDGRFRAVRPDGRGWRVHEGDRLELTAEPLILDSSKERPYVVARPNPPRRVGRVGLLGIRAVGTDPSGFHEADLAVDRDSDTEWVGRELKLELDPRARWSRLSLKTGPTEGGQLAIEVWREGQGWKALDPAYVCQDWAMHELRWRTQVARALRFRWQGPGEARIFEVELR